MACQQLWHPIWMDKSRSPGIFSVQRRPGQAFLTPVRHDRRFLVTIVTEVLIINRRKYVVQEIFGGTGGGIIGLFLQ
jgi:hypothetical protein